MKKVIINYKYRYDINNIFDLVIFFLNIKLYDNCEDFIIV